MMALPSPTWRWRASSITATDGAPVTSVTGEGTITTPLTAAASNAPLWRANGIGGQPAFQFDGVDDLLFTTNFFRPVTATWIVVLKVGNTYGQPLYIPSMEIYWDYSGYGLYTSQQLGLPAAPDTGSHYWTAIYDAGNGSAGLKVDGDWSVGPGLLPADGTSSATIVLGNHSSATRPFSGMIAELIGWNRVLSTVELAAAHDYVQTTYFSTGPYSYVKHVNDTLGVADTAAPNLVTTWDWTTTSPRVGGPADRFGITDTVNVRLTSTAPKYTDQLGISDDGHLVDTDEVLTDTLGIQETVTRVLSPTLAPGVVRTGDQRLSTAARNAAANAVIGLLNAGSGPGKIELRSGPIPASPQSAATGALLATVVLSDPAAPSASNGVSAITHAVTTGLANGTAGWARFLDSNDNVVMDCNVTLPNQGGAIQLSSTSITTGVSIDLGPITYVQPEGDDPVAPFISSDPFGTWDHNGYLINNNCWAGDHGPQTIYAYDWNHWYIITDQPGSGTDDGVKTYADTQKHVSIPVAGIPSIPATFNVTTPGGGGAVPAIGKQWNASFDLWFDNFAHELMIWNNWTMNWQYWWGQLGGVTVTIDGVVYHAYSNAEKTAQWYIRDTVANIGSVDIGHVIADAVARTWIPSTMTLNEIEYGFEASYTGEPTRFTLNNYTLSLP